ncbi:MAG: hypothetical protein IPN69_15865 [Acidobacteria bacterium]|nr:hypothetical protein [Acidobacteriota bacterium]
MKNTIQITFLILATAAAAFAQKAAPQMVIDEAEQISKDKFAYVVKSAKGAVVYGVTKPTDEMLKAIDKGLGDLFAVAKKNRYKKRLKFSDYTIFIAKPDRQKDYLGNYSPDLAVAAKQYAGTEYDKGGYIYAAGIVVAFQPCAFMIGEHTKDFNRVSDVVRYEGEHIVLFHNDRKRYQETADHSKGGSHPILQ